jgi:uncharacterized protein
MKDSDVFCIILKPTLDCNANCKYCMSSGKSYATMSIELFEDIISMILKHGLAIKYNFLWHGGEPLLMGTDFFEKIFLLQDKYLKGEISYYNTIQSNATLVNDEWIDLFHKFNIKVSSSLDGPQHIHNKMRTINNRDAFTETMSGINKLKNNKYGKDFFSGVVCVINPELENLELEEIFDFFIKNKINVRLNPLLPSGKGANINKVQTTCERYGDLLTDYFEKYFYSNHFIAMGPYADIINNILKQEKTPELCQFSGTCLEKFISIYPDGSVYPCGRFGGLPEYKLGTIDSNSNIQTFLHNKKNLLKWKDSEKCRSCKFLSICNKGCYYNSYCIDGSIQENDPFCSSYYKLFGVIYDRILSELGNESSHT